ncbi:MAG: hypothetical protein WDO71_25795 [Bacteroidota bacterium]
MGNDKERWITPSTKWQQQSMADGFTGKTFIPDPNFLYYGEESQVILSAN